MSELPVIDASATLWSREPGATPVLVLLHGYGADEHDLFGLVPYLPQGITVAAVAAPLSPPWPMPGRSWYPIDQLSDRDPAAITAAGRALLTWLDDAVPAGSDVALLGFSQGAAVALQAMRLAPRRFGAVAALSGYAAEGDVPHDALLRDARPPVFWGRGSHDEVIPAPLIEHTAQWLPEHAALRTEVYPGLGHGIAQQELADIHVFLKGWLESLN